MASESQCEAAVDLLWIPLGAGTSVVRASGVVIDAAAALVQRRSRSTLYHAALNVQAPEGRYVIEQTPVPDANGKLRGVVGEGTVAWRPLGKLRVFRYEIRRWLGGEIPDADDAVGQPVRLSDDLNVVRRVLDAVPAVPTPVWGRDDLGVGEMWNSNSVIAWVLSHAGIDVGHLRPPGRGRAPGWNAGIAAASRDAVTANTELISPPNHVLSESISEKITVDINGVGQGMFLEGKNVSNPVLLYLHGGVPDYFLTERYPTGLDEYFNVAWWEQRGSGLSYRTDMTAESVNPEQLVADTVAVTNYLRERFGQEKIYLMGRSGGTFIGIQAAALAPELYHAYMAVAQISNQFKSEKLAFDYMLQRYKDDGNTKMVQRLEDARIGDSIPLPKAYLKIRDVAMHELGVGTTRDMTSIITGMFLPSLLSRAYTVREKVNLWRGKIFSAKCLWNTQLATDLTTKVTRLEIPVYFFHGVHDYTVSYPLAKGYFEHVEAPVKGFYTFEQSAHSPMFEEPALVRAIVAADVLKGSTGLADPEDEIRSDYGRLLAHA
jgi:pimeloyl-ACP methyl ester carboxylesterase